MKGKEGRLFNRALIREGFRQTKWIGGFYLLILLLNLIIEDAADAGISTYIIGYTFYVFAALLIFVLFGFLTKRSASDVYHMLPIKRHQSYFSYGLVTFIWTAVSIVVTMVGIYAVQWQTNHNIIFLDYFYQILTYLSGTVLVIGAALFSVSVAGNTLTAVIVTICILFVPRMILNNYVDAFYEICPHLSESDIFGNIVNWEYNVITRDFSMVNLTRLTGMIGGYDDATGADALLYGATYVAYIYSTIVGVLYCIMGCVLNNRRSSEVAGKTALNKGFSLMLRLAVTMALCLMPILLLSQYLLGMESIIYYSEIMGRYILVIVVWYILEFLTTKSIKKAFKSFLQLPVLIVTNILVLTIFVVSADVTSLNVPEVSEIKSVNITGNLIQDTTFDSIDKITTFGKDINYSGEVLAQIDMDSDEAKEFLSNHLSEDMALYRKGYEISGSAYTIIKTEPIEVVFNTDSGSVRRNIYLNANEILSVYDFLLKESEDVFDYEFPLTAYEMKSNTSLVKIKATGYGMEMKSGDRVALYNSLYEELQKTTPPLSEYIGQVYDKEDAFVYIYKPEDSGDYYLPVSKDTPDSLDLLISLTNQEVNKEYFDYNEDSRFRDKQEIEILILAKDSTKIEHAEYSTEMGMEEAEYNEELKLIYEILSTPSDTVSLDENILVVHYRYFDKYKGSTWTNISDEELDSLMNLRGFVTED